ncbi:MAG: hypothetical protein KBT34_05605 [Prevotella sp.]|nr:hypothetical protein [Candidatus Prevotella equi]
MARNRQEEAIRAWASSRRNRGFDSAMRAYAGQRLRNMSPDPSWSFDRLHSFDKNLNYVGDFAKGSPGYRYTEMMYNKNPAKFLDDSEKGERYRSQVAMRASTVESNKNPERALRTAQYRQTRAAAGAVSG